MIHAVCSSCHARSFDVSWSQTEGADAFELRCAKCHAAIGQEAWTAAIQDDWSGWNDEKHRTYIVQNEVPLELDGKEASGGDSETGARCWFCRTGQVAQESPGIQTLLRTKIAMDAARPVAAPPPHVQVEATLRLCRCRGCGKRQDGAQAWANVVAIVFAVPGMGLLFNCLYQYFIRKNTSDANLVAGVGGMVLCGLGVGVGSLVEAVAHRGVPMLRTHPVVARALAAGWTVMPPKTVEP